MAHAIQLNKITNVELRKFGLAMASLIPAVFGLVIPLLKGAHGFSAWPWILGAIFLFVGVITPQILMPVHKFWMWLGHYLGLINTSVLLFVFYLVVCAPIGLVKKLFGWDPMRVRIYRNNALPTYRIQRDQWINYKHMEKPF